MLCDDPCADPAAEVVAGLNSVLWVPTISNAADGSDVVVPAEFPWVVHIPSAVSKTPNPGTGTNSHFVVKDAQLGPTLAGLDPSLGFIFYQRLPFTGTIVPAWTPVVNDIQGCTKDGLTPSASATDINHIDGVDGAIDGVDYSQGFEERLGLGAAADYAGSCATSASRGATACVDASLACRPSPAQVQAVVDATNEAWNLMLGKLAGGACEATRADVVVPLGSWNKLAGVSSAVHGVDYSFGFYVGTYVTHV